MKSKRSVLIGFVVIACVFLMGFKRPDHHHESPAKKLSAAKEEKMKPKPLDLTVPANGLGVSQASEPLALVQQGASSESLIESDKSEIQALEFKGNVIMSQEPESGKMKHADGAGIMINLHP